jgi:hypothetical protein
MKPKDLETEFAPFTTALEHGERTYLNDSMQGLGPGANYGLFKFLIDDEALKAFEPAARALVAALGELQLACNTPAAWRHAMENAFVYAPAATQRHKLACIVTDEAIQEETIAALGENVEIRVWSTEEVISALPSIDFIGFSQRAPATDADKNLLEPLCRKFCVFEEDQEDDEADAISAFAATNSSKVVVFSDAHEVYRHGHGYCKRFEFGLTHTFANTHPKLPQPAPGGFAGSKIEAVAQMGEETFLGVTAQGAIIEAASGEVHFWPVTTSLPPTLLTIAILD